MVLQDLCNYPDLIGFGLVQQNWLKNDENNDSDVRKKKWLKGISIYLKY